MTAGRFCSACGSKLVDGARFCGSCGAPAGAPAAPRPAPAPGPELQGDEAEIAARLAHDLKDEVADIGSRRVQQLGRLIVSDTGSAIHAAATSTPGRELLARAAELDRQAGSPVRNALTVLGEVLASRRSAS